MRVPWRNFSDRIPVHLFADLDPVFFGNADPDPVSRSQQIFNRVFISKSYLIVFDMKLHLVRTAFHFFFDFTAAMFTFIFAKKY